MSPSLNFSIVLLDCYQSLWGIGIGDPAVVLSTIKVWIAVGFSRWRGNSNKSHQFFHCLIGEIVLLLSAGHSRGARIHWRFAWSLKGMLLFVFSECVEIRISRRFARVSTFLLTGFAWSVLIVWVFQGMFTLCLSSECSEVSLDLLWLVVPKRSYSDSLESSVNCVEILGFTQFTHRCRCCAYWDLVLWEWSDNACDREWKH